ncbi:MAG: hypothetical protein KGI11_09500 [Thaumarchaeota archaeon]|nr:hypothetical protein [Nitrososphaerota archaeon]
MGKKATLKIMEAITAKEYEKILLHLKKIEGFDFSILADVRTEEITI